MRESRKLKTAWRSGVDSNPRCRQALYGRNSAPVWRTIRPDRRHLCRREFVRLDSALHRLSPIRSVRQVEGRCSAMSNARKLRVQIRAIVWRCSAGARAEPRRDGIRICIALQPLLADSGAVASSTPPTISRFAPMRMRRRGVELRLVIGGDHPSAATVDPALKAIAHARSWFEELRGSSDIAECTRDPCRGAPALP